VSLHHRGTQRCAEGKYKAYAEYKDSAIAFLGHIPQSWTATRIKHIGTLKGGAGFPHGEQGQTHELLDFHKVNALGKAASLGFLTRSENTVSKFTAQKLGAFIFPVGSIVFAKVGAALLLARIRWLNAPACIDNNMMGLVAKNDNDSKFVKYAMNLVKFDYLVNPGAIPSLNESQMGNTFLAIPPKNEQKQIAAFLDRETAKIDTLIDKQKKLIALLKEKRQATISHAVTKGLNPNSPMKDSGIEWLGEVPEHWEVKPLKYVCALIDGDRSSAYPNESDLVDKGIPFVSSKNIVRYKLTKKKLNYITNEKFNSLGRGKLADGDLVITVRGTIGHVGIFDPKVIGCETGFINAQMMIMRPLRGLTEYLQWVSESSVWQSQLDVASYGSTVKQLSNQILGNVLIALPPIKDVTTVVKTIRTKSEGFELLITRAQSAIELMKERRTALISAAVTGKIDIRHYASIGEL